MRSKTSNDNYYLLTMAAIAQEIRYRRGERKTDVVLAAGLPLASFGREKKGFREYLFRKEQPLRFRYEDESYEIRIQDVKLFPQGYSALALHPECVRDEPSVLLADIGGWTVDLMRLDNSVPNAATCRSLELGVIRCVDEITEQVRRNTGLSVTDIQIERVLNGQSCSMDPAAKEIIVRQGRLYTEKILSAIMEAGFDLKAIPSVIMGGGASILKRHVTPQDGLCRQVYLTDVHAKLDGEIFSEFSRDWTNLSYQAQLIRAKLQNKDISEVIDLGDIDVIPAGKYRDQMMKTRVGQYFFRMTVLNSYENRCCVTGLKQPELLVASHIKPWKVSDERTERTNPANGLCLNALHDKAFDRGLITLDKRYKIIVSRKLKDTEMDSETKSWFMGYSDHQIILPDKFLPGKDFIEYHNDVIFQR